jgi:CRP-like cAMP-binding protein/tetratricopeptide (TPR) repeat protein
MASPNVDTRKLKDSVAEYLRKQKYDKAVETLEQLVRAEPKDMQHRLKLGDSYRHLGSDEKAITSYQIAAKYFADEGQLIKAIGAVKVILEIDPKNQMAQRELAEMNNRRFAKPTLEAANVRAPRAIGSGARAVSEIELAEGEKAADDISQLLEVAGRSFEAPPDDGEALELDDGKPARKPAPGAKPPPAPDAFTGPQVTPKKPEAERRGPAPQLRPKIELGRDEALIELDQAHEEIVPLDDDLLPPPKAKAPPPPPKASKGPPPPPLHDELELVPEADVLELPDDAIVEARPAKGGPVARPRPPPPPGPSEIEIDVALTPPPRPPSAPRPPPPPPRAAGRPTGAPHPIADLLSTEAEEEIELLSISSDEAITAPVRVSHPPISASSEDLDAAFGAIAPDAAKPQVRVPARVPLFDDLSQDAFIELVNRVSYKRWMPGEQILKEGDPGRSFFVIVEGSVRVFKRLADGNDLQLAKLGEGAFFGEMALLSGAPRTANVAAEEETELLEVTDTVLREVAEKHPGVIQSLKNFYRQRLLNNVMAISPLFKDFDPGERKSIVERFKMRQVAPGDVLIVEGKNSDGLYVVLHGSVRVTKKSDAKEVQLAMLKEGDLFGEMSLLTRKPATATVAAPGPTIVLKLARENFQELILTHPQILELVSDLTEKRRSATEAVLSGQGPGVDGMAFV